MNRTNPFYGGPQHLPHEAESLFARSDSRSDDEYRYRVAQGLTGGNLNSQQNVYAILCHLNEQEIQTLMKYCAIADSFIVE